MKKITCTLALTLLEYLDTCGRCGVCAGVHAEWRRERTRTGKSVNPPPVAAPDATPFNASED